MLIFGLNSYLYTGIISITEMGIKLWGLDHPAFVDYGVRARGARYAAGCVRALRAACPSTLQYCVDTDRIPGLAAYLITCRYSSRTY